MDETTYERFLDWCESWGEDPDDPSAVAWFMSGDRDLTLPGEADYLARHAV